MLRPDKPRQRLAVLVLLILVIAASLLLGKVSRMRSAAAYRPNAFSLVRPWREPCRTGTYTECARLAGATAAQQVHRVQRRNRLAALIEDFDQRAHDPSIRLGPRASGFGDRHPDPQRIAGPHRLQPAHFVHAGRSEACDTGQVIVDEQCASSARWCASRSRSGRRTVRAPRPPDRYVSAADRMPERRRPLRARRRPPSRTRMSSRRRSPRNGAGRWARRNPACSSRLRHHRAGSGGQSSLPMRFTTSASLFASASQKAGTGAGRGTGSASSTW